MTGIFQGAKKTITIDMEEIKQKFHDKQYKLTTQRQIILDAFFSNNDKHLSAKDVYLIVREQYPEIGLATVYRTLELFSELEVLQKINFGDGCNRYEINEASNHHHHHLICLSCGKVKKFEDDLMDTVETAIAKKSNFMIVDHQLKFFGYCQECHVKK